MICPLHKVELELFRMKEEQSEYHCKQCYGSPVKYGYFFVHAFNEEAFTFVYHIDGNVDIKNSMILTYGVDNGDYLLYHQGNSIIFKHDVPSFEEATQMFISGELLSYFQTFNIL